MANAGNARAKFAKLDPGPWYDWPETDPAERAIRFISTYCRSPKGHGHGQLMRLAEFQKRWIRAILAPGVRQAILQCPRGQGKSTLLAALAVWAVFDRNPTGEPSVPIMATTVGQAQRSIYDVACKMIAAEPELDDRSISYTAIANARIVVSYNGGTCFPIANDPDGLQGLDPSFGICDEIGFSGIDSWTALVLASGKRSTSLIVGVGTPGLDRERSALWHLRSAYLDGRTPPGFSFTEYSAPPDCDIRDEDNWRIACPALDAGFQSIDALRVAVEMSPESHFKIFHLARWEDGAESWLGSDGRKVWETLEDDTGFELRDGAPTWAGLDVGLKRDSTALVVLQQRPTGELHAVARIWMPNAENAIDVAEIMQAIRETDARYHLIECAFDPRLFELPAQQLADEGINMVELPQSLERMTPAFGNLYEAIKRRELSHDGDPRFTQQILNAITRPNERGFTLSKRKSRGKIDAAYALCMAFDRAQIKQKVKPPLVVL